MHQTTSLVLRELGQNGYKAFRRIPDLREYIPKSKNIKDSLREKLEAGKDMAFLSKKLATIICDLPIEVTLEELKRREWDKKNCIKFYFSLSLKVS